MKKLKFIRANKTKFGGAEVYLTRLSHNLKSLKIEHDLVHSSIPKFLPSWLRVILFNIQVCITKKKDEIYFSLERITCPDIYRAGDGVHKVFLEIEKKSKLNPLHFVYLFIEKRTFNNAKRIIANSNMIKQQIIDTYKIPDEKIKVVYNGFPLEPFDKRESFKKLEKEFSFLNDSTKDRIILFVGSGFKRKGVEEFLEILSRLENKNFKAFIIGKEKKLELYKDLSSKLNLTQKVFFTGPRTDVKDFYSISDIFIFPTRYEPFSNVVLEALNYGNVVFTTKQNGASEILDSNYVMNDSKDYSVCKKIDELLMSNDILKEAKDRNLEIIKDFSIEKNVKETLDVINEIIN